MASGITLKRHAKTELLEQVYNLSKAGKTPHEIAVELGLKDNRISNMIKQWQQHLDLLEANRELREYRDG